jgi:hypothetical protein
MHRRVNSTEGEGKVRPKVIFAEEMEKEVTKPKENAVTQFKPQSRQIHTKVLPAPSAWESHPNAWIVDPGVEPSLRGSWNTAPTTWAAEAGAGAHDGRVPRALGKLDPQTPSPTLSGFQDPTPTGQWSANPTPGKGLEKGMSYANTSRGKGMMSGKGLSSGKGSSTGKGVVQVLTSDHQATPPTSRSGRQCGFCHSQGMDVNHDFLTCSFRNDERNPNTTE